MKVVASLSQGLTAAAQCGLFTYKSVPVIFEPPYIYIYIYICVCVCVCVCVCSSCLTEDNASIRKTNW